MTSDESKCVLCFLEESLSPLQIHESKTFSIRLVRSYPYSINNFVCETYMTYVIFVIHQGHNQSTS